MPSKKITLPMIEIYNMFVAIIEVEKVNPTMPFKLSWNLDDVKQVLKKPSVRFEEERLKLLKEFGKEREGFPGQYEIKQENAQAFQDKIDEINNVDVEVEITPISLALFEAAKDFQFAKGTFSVLRPIMELPEVVKEEVKEKEPEMAVA